MQNPYLQYSNLIGIPTPIFAGTEFNQQGREVHINGVREMNRPFFEALERFGPADQCPLFLEHLRAQFGLDFQESASAERRKKPFKADLIRILKGWFFDSNRPEGAVLKGWVESRFGLRALFHRVPLTSITGPEYFIYMSEKMHPRFHHGCIFSQLDLLYEFTQQYLRRFQPVSEPVRLYRGFNGRGDESQILEKPEKRKWIIRNNCLASYSQEGERACEFGDQIVGIEAPFSKILCLPQAMPGVLPSYESEVILLGGDYESELIDQP